MKDKLINCISKEIEAKTSNNNNEIITKHNKTNKVLMTLDLANYGMFEARHQSLLFKSLSN